MFGIVTLSRQIGGAAQNAYIAYAESQKIYLDGEIRHVVSDNERLWNIVESELSTQGIDVNSYDTRNILDQVSIEGYNGQFIKDGDVVVIPAVLYK